MSENETKNELLERSKQARDMKKKPKERMVGSFKPDLKQQVPAVTLPTLGSVPVTSTVISTPAVSTAGNKKKKAEPMGRASIKVSTEQRNALKVLKLIKGLKYDYEMIDGLINAFVERELNEVDKQKFKALSK